MHREPKKINGVHILLTNIKKITNVKLRQVVFVILSKVTLPNLIGFFFDKKTSFCFRMSCLVKLYNIFKHSATK